MTRPTSHNLPLTPSITSHHLPPTPLTSHPTLNPTACALLCGPPKISRDLPAIPDQKKPQSRSFDPKRRLPPPEHPPTPSKKPVLTIPHHPKLTAARYPTQNTHESAAISRDLPSPPIDLRLTHSPETDQKRPSQLSLPSPYRFYRPVCARSCEDMQNRFARVSLIKRPFHDLSPSHDLTKYPLQPQCHVFYITLTASPSFQRLLTHVLTIPTKPSV